MHASKKKKATTKKLHLACQGFHTTREYSSFTLTLTGGRSSVLWSLANIIDIHWSWERDCVLYFQTDSFYFIIKLSFILNNWLVGVWSLCNSNKSLSVETSHCICSIVNWNMIIQNVLLLLNLVTCRYSSQSVNNL